VIKPIVMNLTMSMSERSPAPLRQATKKVRMISRLLIMVQDSIYRQPGLTISPFFIAHALRRRPITDRQVILDLSAAHNTVRPG
jgi:hypothetical protein